MRPNSIKFIIKESNINYYSWSLIADSYTSPKFIRKLAGSYVKSAVMDIKNDSGAWGVDLEEWTRIGKKMTAILKRKGTDLDKLILEHRIRADRLFELCDRIEKAKLSKTSNEEIGDWCKALWKDMVEINSFGFIPVISDFEHQTLSFELMDILRRRGAGEIQNALAMLISADTSELYWQEHLELLQIAAGHKSRKRVVSSREFDQHIKRYFWLNYGYQGPIWTRRDFIGKVKKILSDRKSVKKQLSEHRRHFQELRRKQKKLEKTLKLNSEERYLFKAARIFMYLKAYRINIRHRVQYISDYLFKELGRRLSVPLTFFRYATREEILRELSGKKVSIPEVTARRRGMLQLTISSKAKFISFQKRATFLKKYLLREEIEDTGLVKGQAAFLGKVIGRAKLVFAIKDMKKVSKGDVLIAISTTPDLLPAMHRAAAFVTDVGGITSHAAIVSRELKKPCVIGTKFATKIFQDGDLVEVDAGKGVVRKLTKQ